MSMWIKQPQWLQWLLLATLLCLVGCGGGGGASSSQALPEVVLPPVSGKNAQLLVVDSGPAELNVPVVNVPYTSVRVCEPGTSTCQIIDHVIVDTGSTGLRLLASSISLSLPKVSTANGTLYNCAQFLDQTYMWGTVRSADLYLGGANLDGQRAANLPVQVVDAADAASAPRVCAPTGFAAKNTLNALGARGILGIGHYQQDCGVGCTFNAANGYYYTRSTSGRVDGTAVPLSAQLQQPISMFAVDNNGAVISLPAVSVSGASRAQGNLVFGIGTQSNNQPGTVSILTFNSSGYFSTLFHDRTMSQGFVDSGSNALFFGTSSYPSCGGDKSWYCPPDALTLQAVNTGANGQSSTVNFSIANATGLLSQASVVAVGNLAGPVGDSVSFDFGLPFFYGRQVFTAIRGSATPLGVGPYVAY